jgi:hypothetical protein
MIVDKPTFEGAPAALAALDLGPQSLPTLAEEDGLVRRRAGRRNYEQGRGGCSSDERAPRQFRQVHGRISRLLT